MTRFNELVAELHALCGEDKFPQATAGNIATLLEVTLAVAQPSGMDEEDIIKAYDGRFKSVVALIRETFRVMREVEE